MSTFLLRLGLIISVPVACFKHVGIVTDTKTVISCSRRRGGVAEESLAEFSQGAPVAVVGYPGTLTPLDVLRRARSMLGTRWDLFRFNCEHFVSLAHGLESHSPQLQAGVSLAAVVAVFGVASIGSRAS